MVSEYGGLEVGKGLQPSAMKYHCGNAAAGGMQDLKERAPQGHTQRAEGT